MCSGLLGYNKGMSGRVAHPPRIVYAGGFEGSGDYADHRHEHAWELIYLCEGAVTERLGNEAIEMRPGTFVVHPPGSVHGDSAEGDYFLYHILVTPDRSLDWPRFGSDPDGEPIRALLKMVVREWYSNAPHREAFLRHSASLLDILMRRQAIEGEESEIARNMVAAACGRFRRDFPASINMQEVADDLRISRSTLYAYFRQILGRTPQNVLDSIRLKHAVYLLKHSELPIDEIAKGSGYYSSSHLGRKLRHAYQMSASQVRASGAGTEPPPSGR
jgi:AraC-like DNA-binding protein